MARQVIVIHGGTTYAHYEDFLRDLSEKPIYLDRLIYRSKWKELLQAELGNDYQVLLPTMPNASNAKYDEWKRYFNHLTEIIEDDCILIGHSLGAIFLAKYLSETDFPHSIKGTILVAAPYDDEEGEDLTDFKIQSISDRFRTQAGTVTLFFGNDDPVIKPIEIEKYQAQLPDADFHIQAAPDHFVRQEFPELVATIRNLG